MKLKVLVGVCLLATPILASADQIVLAHCFDHRVNKNITYTGTRQTIKEQTDYGQVKIVLPGRNIYYPAHMCILEYKR